MISVQEDISDCEFILDNKCIICSEKIFGTTGKNYLLMEKYGLEDITDNVCYACFLSMLKRCLCIKGEYGKYRIDVENKRMVCYYCDEVNQKLKQFSKNVSHLLNDYIL
jgi:hypothetical protein